MEHTELTPAVALITGGASGIGLATCKAMLAAGAKVVLFDRPEKIESFNLFQQLGCDEDRALLVSGDVRCARDAESAVQHATTHFNRLDILFNNAGIDPHSGPLSHLSEADWDIVLDTNLKSVFLFAKYSIPVFTAAKHGVIINNASVMAERSLPGAAAYSASKAGVVGLTKSLAVELAPFNIRVNSVSPGPVETPLMWSGITHDEVQKVRDLVIDRQPMHRIGLPEEIANVVVFLASVEASYVSGANIIVDGAGSVLSNIPQ